MSFHSFPIFISSEPCVPPPYDFENTATDPAVYVHAEGFFYTLAVRLTDSASDGRLLPLTIQQWMEGTAIPLQRLLQAYGMALRLADTNTPLTRARATSRISEEAARLQAFGTIFDYLVICDDTNNPIAVARAGNFVARVTLSDMHREFEINMHVGGWRERP